jgi:VRR-NUC domain
VKGSDLQKGVIDMAHRYGWKIAHFHAVQHAKGFWMTPVAADGKGFPDLLLVRDRVLAIEIKGDGDQLTVEQEGWIRAFRLAGVQAFVVDTKEWKSGLVEQTLAHRQVGNDLTALM